MLDLFPLAFWNTQLWSKLSLGTLTPTLTGSQTQIPYFPDSRMMLNVKQVTDLIRVFVLVSVDRGEASVTGADGTHRVKRLADGVATLESLDMSVPVL